MALIHGPDSLVLHTRCKWPIPNDLRPERPKVALDAARQLWEGKFPAMEFRSITNTYNCVGMVIASRRVWAYPEDLVKVLTDDGYRKLNGPAEAAFGDMVIYHDDDGEPTHVGLIVSRLLVIPGGNNDPFTILSKWGGDGEYVHKLSDVPSLYGRVAEYWTDRRHG